MKPIAIVAYAAESALGSGESAVRTPAPGMPARVAIRQDEVLTAGGLKKPFLARAHMSMPDGGDPATVLLERAFSSLTIALDEAWSSWRAVRVGVALGSSSGGMVSLTQALEVLSQGDRLPEGLARRAPYFGPLARVPEMLGTAPVELVQVLAACASSGMAVGLGCRWLERGHADLVIAGGYDAVGLLVAAGFESIGATSASRPAPFRLGRDGMALGEGAALVALVRPVEAPRTFAFVRGFGATSDAVHVTAPDREGRGLARAAELALGDAGASAREIDLVSAHATATAYNDAAEARALTVCLGERIHAVPVHPFKAAIGHTLGAGSLLELLAALEACRAGVIPAAAGTGPLDPDARVRLLETSERGQSRNVLGLSAAFGGANSALVASLEPGAGAPRPPRPVHLVGRGSAQRGLDLELVRRVSRVDVQKLSRMDAASELAVTAAASALLALGAPLPPTTAVVVGTSTASVANDELFHRRFRERGAHAAEPRRFPPTSPNLPPGQVSIAFELRGPCLAVGAGIDAALEALRVGFDLVESGDADAALVVALEHVDGTVEALWQAAAMPTPVHGASAIVLGNNPSSSPLSRAALPMASDPSVGAKSYDSALALLAALDALA